MNVVITCPLGSECETIKNNKVHRCRWFVEIAGMHPQTGEQVNKRDCAMAWLPILVIENAATNRGQTQALESFRNEVVAQNEAANQLRAIALNVNRQHALSDSAR